MTEHSAQAALRAHAHSRLGHSVCSCPPNRLRIYLCNCLGLCLRARRTHSLDRLSAPEFLPWRACCEVVIARTPLSQSVNLHFDMNDVATHASRQAQARTTRLNRPHGRCRSTVSWRCGFQNSRTKSKSRSYSACACASTARLAVLLMRRVRACRFRPQHQGNVPARASASARSVFLPVSVSVGVRAACVRVSLSVGQVQQRPAPQM